MKVESSTSKFKELLARFMDEKLPPDAAVEMAYNHLFRKGRMPFFTLNELQDTMIYLKDVMDTNHLTTLDDVLDYYERKKRAVRAYIDSIVMDAPKGPEYIPDSLPESWTKPADEAESSDSLPTDERYGLPCCAHQGMCLLPAPIDRPCVDFPPLVQTKKGRSKRKPADN